MDAHADTALLVLTELFTNALRHAGRPRGRLIETRFECLGNGGLRIEVHDAGDSWPELCQVDDDAEGGRGLALVDALTGGRWGVSGRIGIGKPVWALCAAPVPGEAPRK